MTGTPEFRETIEFRSLLYTIDLDERSRATEDISRLIAHRSKNSGFLKDLKPAFYEKLTKKAKDRSEST